MYSLAGKKILITGASGFIGREVAFRLADLGAQLVLTGRDLDSLQNIENKLPDRGHIVEPCDLIRLDNLKSFMTSLVSADGKKLDGLVHCAGIFPLRPLKSITEEYLRQMIEVNFFSFVEIVKQFSDKRVSTQGSIVALSSYASTNGDKGQLAYSASKGAIDSSVTVLARELINKGIRVNAIRPAALLREDMLLERQPPGVVSTIENMKTGPIDASCIGEFCAFLMSDKSSSISGQHFEIRGYLE